MDSILPVFPGSGQEIGANLHNNASQVGQDLAARGKQALAVPTELLHGFAGFMQGLQTGQRGGTPSVTVQLPAATPAKGAPKAPAAAGAAPAGGKAAAGDPLAALGNLSFRQLLTLSQASSNMQPKAASRPPSAADAAGSMLLNITAPTFQNMLKTAKDDDAKQKIIDNYRDQVLLPLVSHGNPMSGMFDPGAQ